MPRLPLTVIGGYLGAGKTTLINRLLAEEHGQRLLVLVNDFGAINIDAALIAAEGGDTLELTNGCVCCTMAAGFYIALGQALDRRPRPDHLLIEASGIADPAAIANAAKAEPELSYAGVITLFDALNGPALLQDARIAPQIEQQIRAADLLLITKGQTPDPQLVAQLEAIGAPAPAALPAEGPLAPLLFELMPRPKAPAPVPHPAYVRWQHRSDRVLTRAGLEALLATRPDGLYRLKGFVLTDAGPMELQLVGRHRELRPATAEATALVGLGLKDRVSPEEIEAWFAAAEC
ncbi:GTP-binding protein [Pseudodonghicola sp. IC7]|uniref:GTP-binding protein n=1 Tax=Pseudodonghicola flavimaris TaxID=3050036 RepID=A0ABT7F7S6_9RHOB|nr:GTP-binding protein [Pseudodonghicola flavimaris]